MISIDIQLKCENQDNLILFSLSTALRQNLLEGLEDRIVAPLIVD